VSKSTTANNVECVNKRSNDSFLKDKLLTKFGVQNINKCILVGLIIAILCFATIYGVSPFANGAIIAATINGMGIVVVPFFVASSILNSQNLVSILVSIVVAIVAIVFNFYRHKKFALLAHSILNVGIESAKIYLLQGSVLQIVMSGCMLVGFLFVFKYTLSGIVGKGRVASGQMVGIGLTLCLIGLGLASMPFSYGIFAFVALLLILIGAYVGKSVGFVVAVCLANGAAISSFDGGIIALYSVVGLASGVFNKNRLASTGITLVVYASFQIIFVGLRSIDIFVLISFFCAGIVFNALPKSFLDSLQSRFGQNSRQSVRSMVSSIKNNTARQLRDSGKMFEYMQIIMNDLAKSASERDSIDRAVDTIDSALCQGCKDIQKCLPTVQRKDSISNLIKNTLDKENISLVDYPPQLFDKCTQIHGLTSQVYATKPRILLRQHTQKADEYARACVAKQMGGVSKILNNLSQEIGKAVVTNEQIEDKIIAELSILGIEVIDVVLSGGSKLWMTVANGNFDIQTIQSVVSKVLKTTMKVTSIEDNATNTVVVNMIQAPKFDVLFATNNIAKGSVSGDTHSFIKLDNNKFLMAMCDGMGSGTIAEKVSNMAISLVESFYKAGFESEIVLDSINKFLELSGQETFVALDLAIINLTSGQVDFIKLGSPSGYIKSKDKTEILSGSALPLGIVENIKPHIFCRKLLHGDTIVFCTDGITDTFGDNMLGSIINATNTQNPQTLCYSIMDSAIKATNGKVADDMSVIAAKIFATND